MRVRMVTTAAGPEGVLQAGQEYDLSDATALPLLQGHYAVAVAVGAQVTAPPEPERTVQPEVKAKRKR